MKRPLFSFLFLSAGLIGLVPVCCSAEAGDTVSRMEPGNAVAAGKLLAQSYGCGNCHQIEGIEGRPGTIGPPLQNWRTRRYISGALVNNKEALSAWLMDPTSTDPLTAMPNLGVTQDEAEKIAEFLFSQ